MSLYVVADGNQNRMDADHDKGKHRRRTGEFWRRCLGCHREVMLAYKRPGDVVYSAAIGVRRLGRHLAD